MTRQVADEKLPLAAMQHAPAPPFAWRHLENSFRHKSPALTSIRNYARRVRIVNSNDAEQIDLHRLFTLLRVNR